MEAYLCADAGLMPLLMILPPNSWSTCCSSPGKVCKSLRIPFAPSMSDVDTVYASLSLIRKFLFPLFFLTTIFYITYLTIIFVILPAPMRFHRCFI